MARVKEEPVDADPPDPTADFPLLGLANAVASLDEHVVAKTDPYIDADPDQDRNLKD
jgi:hypothetical protein